MHIIQSTVHFKFTNKVSNNIIIIIIITHIYLLRHISDLILMSISNEADYRGPGSDVMDIYFMCHGLIIIR